jgi:3-methylfumaryl-CoA hydratase
VSAPPRELQHVLDTWRPQPEVVQGELRRWPADALAALLGRTGIGAGEALPPLWQDLYLHEPRAIAELGADGHPLGGGLLPPLAQRRRLFGGGRIAVAEPLRLGEVATRTSSVTGLRLREGRTGWLLLLTERHLLAVDGIHRVRDERDLVYRLPGAASRTRSEPAPEPPEPATLRLDVDERVLFLFSALTYNAHRIHYDRRYAVDVEGHPDLLVQGPLLAIGALEAARRTRPDEVAAVRYRLVAPAHPGPVEYRVAASEGPSAAVTGSQHGRTTLEASLTWRS